MTRTIAIGDIHGASVALRALINAIDPQPEDTIVVLGDVIDYGPDSNGVLEQLICLAARCKFVLIQGNDETFGKRIKMAWFGQTRHRPIQ